MGALSPEVLFGQLVQNQLQNGLLDTLKFSMHPPGWAQRTSWEQVRFPRSRKKRIRKKWAKDQRNYGPVVRLVRLYPVERPRLSFVISNMEGA